ncbi:CHAT domain-containing protein [Amycolatopsis aidingensis]|uniref:CHAT domain-containing protein n=1 Tax=Amycolatopsis aidingensis TaxID=2842453 RepID=UPI001E4931E4|nr:CHAT domain-containing tetratricopeptide repeat protein [Amycolatopsis aidingensis]
MSLAAAEAETTSMDAGLARLKAAEVVLGHLPAGVTRRRLRAVAGLQRAVILFRAGRLAESLSLFDTFLPDLDPADDNGILLPSHLMNRAIVHLLMSNPERALTDLQRCLELAVEYGHKRLEGKARHNLGDQAALVGDIPAALHHYEEAARIFESAGPGSLPKVRLDQARALLSAGLADEAARHLDEALPELRRNRVMQDLAEAEVARAAAAILDGDLPMAKRLAGAARRRFLRKGNTRWAEVAALSKLRAEALTALDSADSRAGARLPTKLRQLAQRLAELGLRDEAGVARLLAIRLLLRRDRVAAAEALLAEVPKPRRTTPVDHRMLRRLCQAELAVATGKHRSALAQARAGLTELGLIRDRMGGLDLLSGTAVHGQELGRLGVRVVLEGARGQAGARRVLAWQERTRAQVFRYEPMPVIEDQVFASRITEMRSLQRTVQQLRLEGKPVAMLEKRYAGLQREVSRLGWYTSPWGKPRPVSAPEEVAERLGERALVSLVRQGDALSGVVVRDGRFRLVRLGPLDDVVETTKQLHADLDALAPDQLPEPLANAVMNSARKRAERLDQLLLAPLREAIGDRELVIVPIGPLYALPWPALPSLRGRPLAVAPSATAWVGAASRRGEEERTNDPVLLVGGPGVPGAVGEVRQLRLVYPDAHLVDNELATSTSVLSELQGSRLAHLAAHGMHEPANALFSRLELVDGPLYAHETTRLSRLPERVVLAACELAMSHTRPGEEPLGFAGTLLAAGARSVFGAVARVGDHAAAQTMTELHRLLSAGEQPAAALAEATAAEPLRRPFVCLGAG